MRPLHRLLLGVLAAGCAPPEALSPAEADRIHGSCRDRIATGRQLTKRTHDIGELPPELTGDRVVIYGADWCEACHAAVAYLRRRGIPFVELNVETDPDARALWRRTLHYSGLPERSVLPVMEVRSTVTYGFMPCVTEAAWGLTPPKSSPPSAPPAAAHE